MEGLWTDREAGLQFVTVLRSFVCRVISIYLYEIYVDK